MRFAHFESVKQIKITSKSLHDNLEKVIIFGVKNLIDFHNELAARQKSLRFFSLLQEVSFEDESHLLLAEGGLISIFHLSLCGTFPTVQFDRN